MADDADEIAALHAESWRSAYRGFLPEAFLAGPIFDERRELWVSRMRAPDPHRRGVFKAVSGRSLAGFACVLLDADPSWGALLDNLHVKPAMKRQGIGRQLFEHVRWWVETTVPGTPVHLTVIEANVDARRFYERMGGTLVERELVEVIPGTQLVVLRYRWESP
ncbi:MAG: GNAT family N-acetyltransferase [Vicinamibacterales bacterium]